MGRPEFLAAGNDKHDLKALLGAQLCIFLCLEDGTEFGITGYLQMAMVTGEAKMTTLGRLRLGKSRAAGHVPTPARRTRYQDHC
jgi:hypothetical protein